MSQKGSIVGEIFSSFVRAIFRGTACVISLVFRIVPQKDRVRVIVYRDDGKILLVRGRFSRQKWALPGGGVKRSESCEQAAVRETLEEVGLKGCIICDISEKLILMNHMSNFQFEFLRRTRLTMT
ncbi:NUDIX domain-containing protein [Candidatus Nanosynbacter sp. TM7-087]|uniref:NUDIX hydrolase n=1 Tax=Candidatus Nanosynbacter sp. TM7-087 TaxID=2902631 RepID=UPI0033655181